MTRSACLFLAAMVICVASPASAVGSADGAPSTASPADGDATIGADVVQLGRRWLSGQSDARSSLEALAADGLSDAQEMLGEALGPSGPPALRDEVAACGWFVKAAASRLDALHNAAVCHENGVGATRDMAKAAALYRQAADRGYPRSLCALGNLYIDGQGVPKDETKGAGLCRQGADLGEANAQTDLGNLYLQGVGVPKDMVQARHWYELAAAQGQPNAQFVLGQIYWKGDGVARSKEKAAALLKEAFKGGRRDAAPLLARWLFADWMSAHPRGDFTILDEAIGYQKVAIGSAAETSRGDEETLLDLMRAARGVAEAARGVAEKEQ
ncbi:MAG: tetratricopeptide repeat protein [Sphingomonas bacterium]